MTDGKLVDRERLLRSFIKARNGRMCWHQTRKNRGQVGLGMMSQADGTAQAKPGLKRNSVPTKETAESLSLKAGTAQLPGL